MQSETDHAVILICEPNRIVSKTQELQFYIMTIYLYRERRAPTKRSKSVTGVVTQKENY